MQARTRGGVPNIQLLYWRCCLLACTFVPCSAEAAIPGPGQYCDSIDPFEELGCSGRLRLRAERA